MKQQRRMPLSSFRGNEEEGEGVKSDLLIQLSETIETVENDSLENEHCVVIVSLQLLKGFKK